MRKTQRATMQERQTESYAYEQLAPEEVEILRIIKLNSLNNTMVDP
jgi:hypothetical protein